MLAKLKTLLYTQVYINIITSNKNTSISIEEIHSNGAHNSYEKLFDSASKNKIIDYIQRYIKKTPIHYISILDNSLSQGATPTCTSSNISSFCDLDESKHICYGNDWGYYTSKMDILDLQREYKSIGLDFIFSPFLLLNNFFKDKISSNLGLYILVEADAVVLSIYKESRLLYAEYIDLENQNESQDELVIEDDAMSEEISFDENDSINLEDVDVSEDIEGLDEFDDIENLDTFDEMDEFSEDESTDIVEAVSPDMPMDDEGGFGDDYHRFSLIQSAVNKFYTDDRFESEFIEHIYIADAIGVSGELKKFLEEEMFLSVIIRKIDLLVELCELAKVEVK